MIIHNETDGQWLNFENPSKIFKITSIDEVLPTLNKIETHVRNNNKYAAGFLSYEAAPAFDRALKTHTSGNFPLMCFGLYDKPRIARLPSSSGSYLESVSWLADTSFSEYQQKMAAIKEYILQGYSYQVNFTFRIKAKTRVNPYHLFIELVRSRQARYGAYIETENFAICCASPELFFNLDGQTISSKPMKGTAPRGKLPANDEMVRHTLRNSPKDRAENIMIVDMIRNDLSRICEYGSVKAPHLFQIEKYPTVWQMVSEVNGQTDADISEIFSALFPCASITGAPKVKTMSIIHELENSPRKIYTGTIGFLQPGRRAQFNVAIRTMLIDKVGNELEYGVGSGVVWDSDTTGEYEECLLKSKIINSAYPQFELLETMRVDEDLSVFLLEYHLHRLQNSAAYFDFNFSRNSIKEQIISLAAKAKELPCIMRFLLYKSGRRHIELKPLPESHNDNPKRICLAKSPILKENVFLYHKTTWRKAYETERNVFPEFDDVILWNEEKQVTESTIANLIFAKNGASYTPSVSCGLLNGTYRQWLIDQGKLQEKVICIDELHEYDEIYLINSIREWQPAIFI